MFFFLIKPNFELELCCLFYVLNQRDHFIGLSCYFLNLDDCYSLALSLSLSLYIYIYCDEFPPIFFNFSRYGRSPMCGLLRPRTNEGLKVKEVNVIWMDTWGFLKRTNNITQSWFFSFSLYMYHSYIFFYLKESTTVTTDKPRTKRIQQKCIEMWRTSRSQ